MKKYLISSFILLAILIPLAVWGWGVMVVGGGVSSVTAHCSACPDAAGGADLLCEDVSDDAGDGKLCTWTDNADDGTISWTASHTNTWCCADKATACLQVITTSAGNVHTYHQFGSTQATLHAQFYIDFVSESLANDEEAAFWFAYDDAWNFNHFNLYLYQDGSGNLKIRTKYSQGTEYDTTVTGTTTISTDTVYRVRLTWINASTYKLEVAECDGSNSETIVNDTSGIDDISTTYIGFGGDLRDDAITIEVDNIKCDDDTAIASGCSE